MLASIAASPRFRIYSVVVLACLVFFQRDSIQNIVRSESDFSVSASNNVSQAVPSNALLSDIEFSPAHATSTIAKLTMMLGQVDPVYERALQVHESHNHRFGYSMHVLRTQLISGAWSKASYIMKVLLTELCKPEHERVQWLYWVDVDVVLMNPNIPLEIFLPSEDDGWSHINIVIANEPQGLSNDVFFLRVSHWAVWLMSAVMSLQTYDPTQYLTALDETAMMILLHSDEFRNQTMHVPQRWFNAYPGDQDVDDPFAVDSTTPVDKMNPAAAWRKNTIQQGDLHVHFATSSAEDRVERINYWLDMADRTRAAWHREVDDTSYFEEIELFWKEMAPHEAERVEFDRERFTAIGKQDLIEAKRLQKAKAKQQKAVDRMRLKIALDGS